MGPVSTAVIHPALFAVPAGMQACAAPDQQLVRQVQVVTPETMLKHLQSLEAEGHEALIFLKHLSELTFRQIYTLVLPHCAAISWTEMLNSPVPAERLEVLEWKPHVSEPVLRYACSVSNSSDSCLMSRSLFSRAPSAGRSGISDVYRLQLLIEKPLSNQRQTVSYLISQQKGGRAVLPISCCNHIEGG